jgi:NADH dehydrogenase (ubiquinone) 1 beta subcomplex subunit 10
MSNRSPPFDENHFVGRGLLRIGRILDAPVTWFREKIVEPNRKEYNWYHQQFRRVPTIDECYIDDRVCIYEADQQFKRDRLVDSQILNILRLRMDDCVKEELPDHMPLCGKFKEDYEKAAGDWFSRYGDLGANYNVEKAYMKQKHRLLWERRHGKIGSGMRSMDESAEASSD